MRRGGYIASFAPNTVGIGEPDCPQCGLPESLSEDDLKAYAACCTEEKAKDFIVQQTGIDPSQIPINPDGSINFKKAGIIAIEYVAGTSIDPNILNDDGSVNFKTVVADAGSIAAAAICTAYGAGAVAALCGTIGGAIGAALYDAGSTFVAMFESDPPYVDPSPQDSVNKVAHWYGNYQLQYAKNLATARGLVVLQYHLVFNLNQIHSSISGVKKTRKETWDFLVTQCGMPVIDGWMSLLGLKASSLDDLQASESNVQIAEIAVIRVLFGFGYDLPDLVASGQDPKDTFDDWIGAKTELFYKTVTSPGYPCLEIFSPGAYNASGTCVPGAAVDPNALPPVTVITASPPVIHENRLFYVWPAKGGTYLGAMTDSNIDVAEQIGLTSLPSSPPKIDDNKRPVLWEDGAFGAPCNTVSASDPSGDRCVITGWGEMVNVTQNGATRAWCSRTAASMTEQKTVFVQAIQSAAAKFPLLAIKEKNGLLQSSFDASSSLSSSFAKGLETVGLAASLWAAYRIATNKPVFPAHRGKR